MSEKSKGDTSRVVNNPLLSASVTGLTFDDFPSAPLLLPAAPPVERSPPPVLEISSDTKETVHGKELINDSDTFSEINLNAPADEDFNQAESPSFISPLEENPAVGDSSLLSQAASSFSQLPSVASTVFSTFSKVIKEYSPTAQDNDYTNSIKADQPVAASFDSFYAPATNPVDSSSPLNVDPTDQSALEPPKFYSPAEVPALPSAIQAQNINQNTYRLSAKKKTYAQIPGLSSNALPPQTSILAPPTLPPAVQPAATYPVEPQQNEFLLGANESSFADSGHVFGIQATSADVQPFANTATSKKEERRGLFSLSNVVAPVWQNLSGFVSRGNNQDNLNAGNPYPQGPVNQPSSLTGVYAPQSTSPGQYFTSSPQPFVNEGYISPTTYAEALNARIESNTASYFTPNNQEAYPQHTRSSVKENLPPPPPKSVTPIGTPAVTPDTQNFPQLVPTPPTSFLTSTQTTFQQSLPFSTPQTFPPLNPATPPLAPTNLNNQTLSSKSNTPLAPPPTSGNSFRLQKGTRHYKTPLGISTNPVSSSSFFSSNVVTNPQAPKQFAPIGSVATESTVVNKSAASQPQGLFVPAVNENNPQADQVPSIQHFTPINSTLTENTSISNQPSAFQPLAPIVAPGIQNTLKSRENPIIQPFAAFSTAPTEHSFESKNVSATLGATVTESIVEPNKPSTIQPVTSFFTQETENTSELSKPPPIGFITSETFPPKPQTPISPTTYLLSNTRDNPQQFDQIDLNQHYPDQSKIASSLVSIASPLEERQTEIFQPNSTQKTFPPLPITVATSESLISQFTPEIPSAPPAEPAPFNFSFDRENDRDTKNYFGLQTSSESGITPLVSKIDSSDILKEDDEIETEVANQTEPAEITTVEDKPKELSTASFFASEPFQLGITDANKTEPASFIENLQPIKTLQPSICEVSQQAVFEKKQSRNLDTTPFNKLETSTTIGSSAAIQPFTLNHYFSSNTVDIPASKQPPTDVNANKPSEEVIPNATTPFQNESCADSVEFFSPIYNADFNKNIASANLPDPRSFFDSFQQQAVNSTPVSAQQLDDEVNSNFTVDRKSGIENSFQIQNFFNNPPQNLNQSASELNYKLVGSNLVKRKYIDELSSSRAISPQSNVVEPPSSACSEFSADSSLQSNLNTSKVSNVEADILLDSLIKEYIDEPEIMALLMNNKPSTSANAAYKPAVKHWFSKRKVDDKLIWSPFSQHDSALIESHFNNPTAPKIVAVEGGRYDVNIDERHRTPVYWSGEATEVRRCSWFYKALDSRYVPYEEDIAEKLETEYEDAFKTNEWHRKIPLPTGETVVFHGPTVLVHFLQIQSSDSWGTATQTTSRPRVVKRDLEDFCIETGESNKVDHLLFMVHGIGSVCDLKFRTVEEVVDEFRSIATQLIQSHYKISCESGRVGRVEVLPVSWHSELHSEESGIDEKLKAITLESIPKLRNFANDTLLDVLFYTSPVFCQNIMDTVAGTINKLYAKYCQRNPSFSGGVSLAGHSLGSLILFDLLCHQKPVEMADIQNSENPDQPITPIQIRAQTPVDEEDMTKQQISYTIGPAGTGQAYISYPQLVFQPKKFFALGSPIGMFVTIRGIDRLGLEFKLPTCPGFFNIFHPYDPVAYRVEALVNTALSTARPVLVPHHKGRKRMHLELKETMSRVGADIKQRIVDTFKNTMETVYQLTSKQRTTPTPSEIEKEVDKVLEMQLNMDKENARARSESVSGQSDIDTGEIDLPLGRLNDGKRIDYVLQEAPLEFFNEYLFALTSHVCYWESADTILFIMKEIYSSLGVQTDSQVPQQSMTIERPQSSNGKLSPDSNGSVDSSN